MLFLSVQNCDFSFESISPYKIDGIELRLDLFPRIDIPLIQEFCARLSLPVLFTLRKKTEGGNFSGSEEQRLQKLEELLSLSPAFVDIEYGTCSSFIRDIAKKFPQTKIILSHHNFEKTPQDLENILFHMASEKAYAYKIVTFAHSVLDALRMLHFVHTHKENRISGICMGKEGSVTRILGPIFGNFIDYAVLDEKEKTAPGQLTFSELQRTYHYQTLRSSTAIYGLIGDPVDHSMSHVTHNALLRHQQCNAVYVKMRVETTELAHFLSLASLCGISGLSVTAPLKESLLPILQHLDQTAKECKAVNTLCFSGNSFIGYNTDGKGALDALEQTKKVKGKKILLLGAGGAARAIAYEAHRRGAFLTLLNRTQERAYALAREIGCTAFFETDYDIIINATPCAPRVPLIPEKIAMDIVSYPKMTAFLSDAQETQHQLVFGYEMFVLQAKEQFRLWLNTEIDEPFLKQQCEQYLAQHK